MSSTMSSEPSPSRSGPSEADREDMLDRMLTRLALADDSDLQSLLPKILPYSISALSSPSPSIRKLVMEILSHINKRVKNHPEIGLPFSELWMTYKEATASLIVRNFCIVYIEMAFERLPSEEKVNMPPELLVGLMELPSQHQDILLRIVAKVIGECHSSKVDEDISAKYGALGKTRDGLLLLEFCLQTMLYEPPSTGVGCPAGLSIAQSERVTGKLPLKGDMLVKRKLGILNVLDAMQLRPEILHPYYLVASSDSQEPVSRRGEDRLKRNLGTVNLDDSDMISKLFVLFNGTTGVDNVPVESRISPVNPALRVRLMSVFCRSVTAANSFPSTLQCIFGCMYGSGSTARLKQLGMEFCVWVFRHARNDQLKLMGPVVLSGILKSIDAVSTPGPDVGTREIKAFAFQSIGLLTSRMPSLFRDKVDMAVRLFTALKQEDQSLRLTIQESVTSLAVAYKDAPAGVLRDLEALLLENSQMDQSEVRFCALRLAASLFDMDHCPSRYICMLGAADSKIDIREVALEGLGLMKGQEHAFDTITDRKYPRLKKMLDYIYEQQPKLLESEGSMEGKLLFPSKTYLAMIKFLMKCFEVDYRMSESTASLEEFQSSVEMMFPLLEHAVVFEGSVELHATSTKALVDIGSRFPKMVTSRYAERLSWLKQLLGHIDIDTRESAARLLGFACSAVSSTAIYDLISDLKCLLSGTQAPRFENQHGVYCAIGYVIAECMTEPLTISNSLLSSTIEYLVNVVESESSTLASIGMEALGHVGLRCPLPKFYRNSVSVGVMAILHERLTKLVAGDDIKAVQKIVLSLGHICSNESSIDELNVALGLIFSLCRSKVEEVLFAAGEALSFLWGGVPVTADVILKSNYVSLSQSFKYLTSEVPATSLSCNLLEKEINEESRAIVQDDIMKKLFDVLLYSNRKEERCAGTVWLVSLAMYCGRHPKIQQILPDMQETFSHLLGDQNDLTQELASQGMSIVYELGDPSVKQELVNALVSTLTGSGKRKRAVKLMEDTEVFQEGTIGASPSGGKLSTYKELCSLANEMGQPDLIYKFMELANHQAALNSKRGAAFGFSKIAKHAGDALKPHLSSLIPRLVRYQYDPDKNVQEAMGHIWKSIVAEPKKTIDEYFDIIVDDLLIQTGSRLWRSREASCLALADIIHGRKFSQVSKHLKRIWVAAFRAMDDIKETVRKAGDILCRAVSSLTVRLCDVSLTAASDAKETMNIILPLLLVEGIVSKVATVQKASIDLVMKLAKGAGIAIRPHLPDLVCCMLECLSSLEDQRLNYVELHAVNVGIQTEKLENLRIAVAKDSPMWETLDLCLKVVEAESLRELVPRLAQLVRSGVGLNTRVGVANFITLLVQKVNGEIRPFTGMLLKVLFNVVLEEKSYAAKRAFSAACAMDLKFAGSQQAQKLIEDTSALHLGERNAQMSCGILLKNYFSLAAEVVSGYHASLFPIIFVSRFDDDKDISILFEELWEENVGNERAITQLYLAEIVALLCDCISSSSWASKRKSAKATEKLCEVLGESLSPFHQDLLTSLLKEVHGRFWEGKHTILHAIGSLCTSCSKAISTADPDTPDAILNAISSACTKKMKSFREAALSCLKQVLEAFGKPEFFNSIFPMLHDVCNQATVNKLGSAPSISVPESGEDNMEGASVPLDKVISCVASCIHIAFLQDILEQRDKLVHIVSYALSPGFNWTVKLSAFTCIDELCSKISPALCETSFSQDGTVLFNELFHTVAPRILECFRTVKIAQVHNAASECLLEMCEVYKHVPPPFRKAIEFRDELRDLAEVERSEQAKTLIRKCLTVLDELQQEKMQMI